MKKEDIKNMAVAWQQVKEATAQQRALASIKPQSKDKVSLAPAPWDKKKEEPKKEGMSSKEKMAKGLYASKKEAMDPVDKKELKGKHADRDDKDIDNDGDADSSDKYLHKRRKAITKNVKGDKDEVEMNPKQKKGKADADNMTAESFTPVYARILENRAAHYKSATDPQTAEDGGSPKAKELKKKMDDGKVDSKISNYDELGHDDAAKAGRAGPSKKARRNDNAQGDKAIINPAKATK